MKFRFPRNAPVALGVVAPQDQVEDFEADALDDDEVTTESEWPEALKRMAPAYQKLFRPVVKKNG